MHANFPRYLWVKWQITGYTCIMQLIRKNVKSTCIRCLDYSSTHNPRFVCGYWYESLSTHASIQCSCKGDIHWTKVLSVHPDNSNNTNNLKMERQNDTNFEQFCNWCVSWILALKKKRISWTKISDPWHNPKTKKSNPCSTCLVQSATF
jgi:hypothetical protein